MIKPRFRNQRGGPTPFPGCAKPGVGRRLVSAPHVVAITANYHRVNKPRRQSRRERARRVREFYRVAVIVYHERLRRPGTIVRTEAASYTPLTGIGQKLKQLAQFVARTENNAGKLLTMSRRPPHSPL